MRQLLINLLGGYASIDEAIYAIQRLDDKQKYTILSLAVAKLFNTITVEDILQVKEDGWYFVGRRVTDEEQKMLVSQASGFIDSKLWAVLKADIQYQANKKMYLLATNEVQVATGKLWTLMLDAFQTRLRSLKQGSGSFNQK